MGSNVTTLPVKVYKHNFISFLSATLISFLFLMMNTTVLALLVCLFISFLFIICVFYLLAVFVMSVRFH